MNVHCELLESLHAVSVELQTEDPKEAADQVEAKAIEDPEETIVDHTGTV